MKRRHLLFLCALSWLPCFEAAGFTFSDGTTMACFAAGRLVPEFYVEEDTDKIRFTGRTVPVGSGYRIIWNVPKLKSLPPEMQDYLFFHECAHARVPTRDEVQANCVGLRDMRAAGRAGFAVEARIAAFYGAGNDYWAKTLKCANAETGSPATGTKPPS